LEQLKKLHGICLQFGQDAIHYLRSCFLDFGFQIRENALELLPITRKRINLNTCPDPEYGPVITCAVELADMG
jgi:hypothetical protein